MSRRHILFPSLAIRDNIQHLHLCDSVHPRGQIHQRHRCRRRAGVARPGVGLLRVLRARARRPVRLLPAQSRVLHSSHHRLRRSVHPRDADSPDSAPHHGPVHR